MSPCAKWRDAVAAAALGGTQEPGLAAHLATCPQCADALRESREMAARIDGALHRAAAVEPPAYGPERVMARIHGQPDTRAHWRWAAVGGVVLAALVLMVLSVRRPARDTGVIALSTWRSPTQALLRPPVAAAWTTKPRLGEGFFEMKLTGEIHAQ